MLDHIRSEWHGVALPSVDPDICFKVDSALLYVGCTEPSKKLRQFLYLYNQSEDFDCQTLRLLALIFNLAGDDKKVWDNLVALEFQRDCGMHREEYIELLTEIAEELSTDDVPVGEIRVTEVAVNEILIEEPLQSLMSA